MKIADIHNYKNGNKRVNFYLLGIYNFIKNQLDFRWKKVDGKGYYFQRINGHYVRSNFYEMQDCFTNYIRSNFSNLEINGDIEYMAFLNAYHQKLPLKNGNFARTYLSQDFELSGNEVHNLKMETDLKYRYGLQLKEMKLFIIEEGFISTNRTFGNFFDKESKVYYKQINETFLVLANYPQWNTRNGQATYDLFKVNAKDENEFFKKRDEDIVTVMLGFNLNSDMQLYNAEKFLYDKKS